MSSTIKQQLLLGVTLVIAFIWTFPVLWLLFTGFKSESDAIAVPPTVFVPLTLDHYKTALFGNYGHFLLNTLIAVLGSILAAFSLGLPAAYKLAYFPGRRANDLLLFALSTRFMPGVAVIVPIFLLFSKLGLIDSLLGLTIMYTTLNIPIVMWLMRSFFKDLPFELIECAMLEGAPHRIVMTQIVLPLSKVGLATTAFLLVILTWNEFFFAVNLSGHNAATLPVYMASFFTTEGQTWAQMSAAAVLAVAPVVLAGWMASRALVKDIAAGAIK